MKNFIVFIVLLFTISASALTKEETRKFAETTKSLTPLFCYNMHLSLYKGVDDSIFVVSNKGDIILKLSSDSEVKFNSNIDFEDSSEEIYLVHRTDVNLDEKYPLIVVDNANGQTYAIDYTGKTVVGRDQYDEILPFVDGYALVMNENGLWGVINTNLEEVVPLKTPRISHIFINHNIWLYSESDQKWHMLDREGKEIGVYDGISYNVNDRWMLVESNFRRYLKNRSLGITVVKKNGKWGAVDISGNVVVPFVNDSKGMVSKAENGMVFFGESIFDQNGNLVFSPADPRTTTFISFGKILTEKTEMMDDSYVVDFDLFDIDGKKTDYLPISDGFRWHLIKNEWILEEKNGRLVSGSYEDVTFKHDCPNKDKAPWSGDRADEFFNVVDEGKAGLIDKNGKFVLPMKYSSCSVDHNALKGTILDGNIRYVAFYDFNGKEIQPMALHKRLAYENFGWHYEGTDCTLDAYQVNGKWGLLDMETKKTVVPFCLDDVLAFMNGVGVVKYKGRLYYINEKGEGLPDEVYLMK